MNIEIFKRSFNDGIRLAVCVPFEHISSWYALCAEHNITDFAGCSVYENNHLCSLAKCTYSPDDDPMCFIAGYLGTKGLMVDRRSFFENEGWYIVDFSEFDEFIPETVIKLDNDRFSETIISSLDGMLHGFQ